MTITLEEFKLLEPVYNRKGEVSVKVELFLKDNRDKAFTTKEIDDYLKSVFLNRSFHASVVLHHLRRKGIVEHKSPYWKIKEENKLFEPMSEDEKAWKYEDEKCICGHSKEDHCSTDSRNILNHCELCRCKLFKEGE